MKKKIIGLKILTSILTVLIGMIELWVLILYIKYLVKNNYPIMSIILGIIAIIIINLIYPTMSKNDYKNFEEKEALLWDKLTLKRTILFMLKYHVYLIYKILYLL